MLSAEGKEVSPSLFIKEAASQKVAEKIDRWVVVQSIKALAREYQEGRPTRLIINITPQTLSDDSFVPWLGMALKASRLPHDALVFQLAEHEAYRYLKEAKATCNALAGLHCKVSMSRFGAMANACNLFRHVHVDYVKSDGSYTKDLASDGEKALLGLVEQVHAVGKITIATFVEEVKVLTSLYGLGVHYIQGYYLQPPAATMDYDFSGDDDEEEEVIY
jgi:EAL domain-containing protein (putative c-di-GMP-specific phosphodiesterase class I)